MSKDDKGVNPITNTIHDKQLACGVYIGCIRNDLNEMLLWTDIGERRSGIVLNEEMLKKVNDYYVADQIRKKLARSPRGHLDLAKDMLDAGHISQKWYDDFIDRHNKLMDIIEHQIEMCRYDTMTHSKYLLLRETISQLKLD